MTLHKYSNNQVTQGELEPQDHESTTAIATLYSKARALTLTGYQFTGKISEKKVQCSQISHGNNNRLNQEPLYQTNLERLENLDPKNL